MTWSDHVIMSGGVRLVCRDWGGSGLPVFLLHGLAGHAGEWDATAQSLSPRYRIIALDQRGHGGSERLPSDVSRAAYVADVVTVIDQLELPRPVMVGQSLGGHTAMLTAAAHPDRVRALVLVEAGPGGGKPNAPIEIGKWLDSWPTPFPTRQAAVRFLGGGSVGEGWAAGLEEREDGWWPRFDRDVIVRSLTENSQRSYWAEWKQVVCPTLVVLAQSSFIPRQQADDMLCRRPATMAVSIPNTGHDLHLERPQAMNALLASFLDEIA